MVCIYCGSETKVVNSRRQKRTNHVWRRRRCTACGAIFTSIEAPDLLKGLSVRRGKHLEAFSRDKLFLSIHDSLKHRKTAQSDATGLTDTVIGRLYPLITDGCLDALNIVNATSGILKRFDKVASVHYLAFHAR